MLVDPHRRLRSCHPVLRAALAVALCVWPAARAIAAPSPAELDNAETNVCAAQARLDQATAAALEARRGSTVPAEALTGRKIDDPARRGALQAKVDEATRSLQDRLVENSRRDLARYQTEHRRLTGREFNTAQCEPGGIQTRHQRAFEAEQQARTQARHAQMKASLPQTEQQMIAAFELERACRDKATLDQRPEAQPKPSEDELGRAGRRYASFVAQYERANGRPFDPALCRKPR